MTDPAKITQTIGILPLGAHEYHGPHLPLETDKLIAEGIAAAHGAEASVTVFTGYPVTINHPGQTEAALGVASEIVGTPYVEPATTPTMGGEDFSYMLNARPGNFIFIGNGDTAGLHNPNYDFNDEIIPYGVSYWVKLAETRLTQIA